MLEELANGAFKTGIITGGANMCKCACIIQEVLQDGKKVGCRGERDSCKGEF